MREKSRIIQVKRPDSNILNRDYPKFGYVKIHEKACYAYSIIRLMLNMQKHPI